MKLILEEVKNSKLSINEMDDNLRYLENYASNGSLEQNPSESIKLRTHNKYIDFDLGQSVEIESEDVTYNVIYLGAEGYIELDAPLTLYNGDTVTISGSSIESNNGTWVVTNPYPEAPISIYSSIFVENTAGRMLQNDGSEGITVTWKKRKLVELSWIQAQLEDGTLIWEAYDYQNWDKDEINGYWVAMRPNLKTGEYDYISYLKMSHNFWSYWYEYTVKVEGEPLSVILTTLAGAYLDSTVGSANFKLSIVGDQLVLEETIYDLRKSWIDLYFEMTNTRPMLDYVGFSIYEPRYCSDNDWYGMMSGPEMGWCWLYWMDTFYGRFVVGYNMLTGQTKCEDISSLIVKIKNISLTNKISPILEILKSVVDFKSHPKFGFLIFFNTQKFTYNTNVSTYGVWSPYFTNVEYLTLIDYQGEAYWYNKDGLRVSYSINNDYMLNWGTNLEIPNREFKIGRKKIDTLPSDTTEYSVVLTDSISYEDYRFDYNYYERENSFIITMPNSYSQKTNFFLVWRNDKPNMEYIKSPFMYPNMIEDNKLTDWSRIWTIADIKSLTNIYKNNTF